MGSDFSVLVGYPTRPEGDYPRECTYGHSDPFPVTMGVVGVLPLGVFQERGQPVVPGLCGGFVSEANGVPWGCTIETWLRRASGEHSNVSHS